MNEDQIKDQIGVLLSPWYRFFLSYDPAADLLEIQCPVLALIGSLDLQAPPKENLQGIEQALKAGGNRTDE